jgi:hypothetical protein
MRIEILSEAEDDLVAGAKFYERRSEGNKLINIDFSPTFASINHRSVAPGCVAKPWVRNQKDPRADGPEERK